MVLNFISYNYQQNFTQKFLLFIFHIKQRFRDVEAEYPVKGSELHPRDSSKYELRCAIAISNVFALNMNFKYLF